MDTEFFAYLFVTEFNAQKLLELHYSGVESRLSIKPSVRVLHNRTVPELGPDFCANPSLNYTLIRSKFDYRSLQKVFFDLRTN